MAQKRLVMDSRRMVGFRLCAISAIFPMGFGSPDTERASRKVMTRDCNIEPDRLWRGLNAQEVFQAGLISPTRSR